MKATAIAPTNLAVIKYWGKQNNDGERLPTNANLSLTVDSMLTTTTIQFSPDQAKDSFTLYGEPVTAASEVAKLSKFVDSIRKLAGVTLRARMVSTSNVPPSCGFSSSASGFAALTLAATSALGIDMTDAQLSVLARQGSGSASRSMPRAGGLVQWRYAQASDESFAKTVAPASAWPDLCIVAVVISRDKKYTPTTEGMKGAQTSPFFTERLRHIAGKISAMKKAYDERDFTTFARVAEQEALELHAIMMTQAEPCLYLHPGTLGVMQTVQREWRQKLGLEVYFTVNTGQNPWLLVRQQDLAQLTALLDELPEVQEYIAGHIGRGTHVTSQHLF